MLPSPYNQLLDALRRAGRIQSVLGVLNWDEQVNLPPGSAGLRGSQLALMAELYHREATRPEIGDWLDRLEAGAAELDADQRAMLREARRDYDRLTRLPADFVARRTEAQSRAYHAWVRARAEDDFAAFAPFLTEQLAFARETAAYHEAPDPYDFWIDTFDPGMDQATIRKLFAELRSELQPIVQAITSSPRQPDTSFLRGFPVADQEAFLREVVAALGFDRARGRIDVAVHPFCGGHPDDCRITTRYKVDDPLDSLSGAMHETGHALYEQGLPAVWRDTPLGHAAGMAAHESQSRLWENQVGRSRAFWQYWEPRYRARFPQQLRDVDSEALYRALNRVALTPIRVDADEVTYNLHIMLRFELERRLFSGDLAPADLPAAWNSLSAEILGFTPPSNRVGCLQDVHWSGGAFGYFPSYCLGNLFAAQLWYAVRDALPDLDKHIAAGDNAPLLAWLRANIHCHGRRYTSRELVRVVTGAELSPAPLVRYLRERYLPLYS